MHKLHLALAYLTTFEKNIDQFISIPPRKPFHTYIIGVHKNKIVRHFWTRWTVHHVVFRLMSPTME